MTSSTMPWTSSIMPWTEYTPDTAELDPVLADIKKAIISEYGPDALRKSWLKTCKALETVTAEIANKKTSMIPDMSFKDFMALDGKSKDGLKHQGCFVVRGVIDKAEATEWFDELKAFIEKNDESIVGWPKETPFMKMLYYSSAQVKARTHPNSLALQKELNSWWSPDPDTKSDPLVYVDALRIRPPGIPFKGLGPHIDAGSLARWADPAYRKVYDKIFSGFPESHDPYDMTARKQARQDCFGGSAHSSVLRAFQGWTALTEAGPKEGSLLIYPNLTYALAYMLLRPFFDPPEETKDIMDAEKWTFSAEGMFFPGTFKEDSQNLSPSSHPHLRLEECMVNIPRMQPGDTVWWFCDMIHAVEVEHTGTQYSSVVYVGATPSTPNARAYVKEQLRLFKQGLPPQDFPKPADAVREPDMLGYVGEKLLDEAGRLAMGYGLA